MKWRLVFTRQAKIDAKKVKSGGLQPKVAELLEILANDPFAPSPPFKLLRGDFARAYSRRINRQHRIVYEVIPAEWTVKVIRMWTHYE